MKLGNESREKYTSLLNRVEEVLNVIADAESTKKVYLNSYEVADKAYLYGKCTSLNLKCFCYFILLNRQKLLFSYMSSTLLYNQVLNCKALNFLIHDDLNAAFWSYPNWRQDNEGKSDQFWGSSSLFRQTRGDNWFTEASWKSSWLVLYKLHIFNCSKFQWVGIMALWIYRWHLCIFALFNWDLGGRYRIHSFICWHWRWRYWRWI